MKRFFCSVFGFLKKYLTLIIIAFIFLFLFVCDRLPTRMGGAIIDNLKSIATSFTPTTDLFDDGSEVSFVSYFFGMKVNKSSLKCNFILQSNRQNMSTTDDYLFYNSYGMVNAIADGKIKSIGYTLDGEKYLEIEHNEGYKSRYVGRFVLGVTCNENVIGGRPILTLDEKNNVKIYIYQNDNLVKISEIEWKN